MPLLGVFERRTREVVYTTIIKIFGIQMCIRDSPISALNPAYELVMNKVHSNNFAPIPSDTKENQLCNISMEDLKLSLIHIFAECKYG